MGGPFLKWAGGKAQLLAELLVELPRRIATYYEPFIGGGALFFALAAEHRFERAVIADRNPAVIEAYKVVRDDVDALIEALGQLAPHATDEAVYYRIRAASPATPIARAARLIYLNRTCFNGLCRLNRRGEFNVPFGRYANPRVLNVEVLRAASRALAGVEIQCGDFERVSLRAKRGDAIYFDPPYLPVSATSSFTAYDGQAFDAADHRRLSAVFDRCVTRGAVAVLSSSDTPVARALYRGAIRTVSAKRAINAAPNRRAAISELVVIGRSGPSDVGSPAAEWRREVRA